MDNNISFGANFIRKIPIKQYSYENKLYTNTSANFVELNPTVRNDLKTLKEIIYEFGDDSYAGNIYYDAIYLNKNKTKFFALTRQKDSFEILKAGDILGIAETTSKGNNEIELKYLQIHPQFIYPYHKQPFYKRIGSAILDCFKTMHKKINVRSAPAKINFYTKNGFTPLENNKRLMYWEKKN